MFKKQILAQLRRANPGVSEKVLGLIADKLAAKVTAEDQIEGAIAELVENSPISIADYAELLQREGDRRVTEATKKPAKPGDDVVPSGDDPEPNTEIGKLTQLVGTLAQAVNGLVKEKTVTTIKSKMEQRLTDEKIPLFLLKGRVPETEEEIEDVLLDIKQDWSGHSQETSTKKLQSLKPPVNGVKVTEEEVVDPDVADYAKRKMDSLNLAK